MNHLPEQKRQNQPGQPRAVDRERGVALIVVMSLIVVLTALVAEYTTNSTVNFTAAASAREAMRGEFLNRSGANLAQLLMRLQTDVVDKNKIPPELIGQFCPLDPDHLTECAGMYMGLFGGSKEEREGLLSVAGIGSADAIEGLGMAAGEFSVNVATEDGKLNMNCANGSETSRKNLQAILEAVMLFEAYDPLFEQPSADGWQRTRQEQVAALMDYIDKDTSKAGQRGTSEDYGYEGLDDPYKVKNNYIDTVSELKLVRGVDDRFWTLFGGLFTVYGDCKVNLTAVKDPKLIAAVIFLSAKDPEDPVVATPAKLWALAKRVSEGGLLGTSYENLNEFADFVKSPDGLAGLLGDLSQEENAGLAEAVQGLEPVEGVELDPAKLGQIAKVDKWRFYRVEVTSSVGVTPRGEPRFVHKLVGIWDTQVQNQNARNRENRQGAWVFWKEE